MLKKKREPGRRKQSHKALRGSVFLRILDELVNELTNIFVSLLYLESSSAKNYVLFFIMRVMQILCSRRTEVKAVSEL